MRSLRAALIKVGMFSGTNVLLVEARSGRAAKQSSIRNGGMVVVGGGGILKDTKKIFMYLYIYYAFYILRLFYILFFNKNNLKILHLCIVMLKNKIQKMYFNKSMTNATMKDYKKKICFSQKKILGSL